MTVGVRSGLTRAALVLCAMAGLGMACNPTIKSTLPGPPTAAQLAQLWVEPDRGRDLFWGVGGKRLAPDPSVKYQVIEIKRGGYSRGYTVLDPKKREWSAKFPPEAGTEIVASRLHWGIGYHQPPIYLIRDWRAEKATSPNPQLPARFREKNPDLNGLDAGDPWSYFQNPFVGTPQLNGLLALQAMLGNSDLKDAQNVVYTLKKPLEGATTWYVARDLGQTFGRTGVISAPRGDIEVYEETPFIRGRREREGQIRLSRPPQGAVREHPARARAVDLRAAEPIDRSAVDRRIPRRGDRRRDGRTFHQTDQAEDRRRPRAPGSLMQSRIPPSAAPRS